MVRNRKLHKELVERVNAARQGRREEDEKEDDFLPLAKGSDFFEEILERARSLLLATVISEATDRGSRHHRIY